VPKDLDLSNLSPAQPRKNRKRVGRGQGSGKGRYSGRGIKGQKSRSGSAKMRPGFEGGQNPIYMRLGKLRGGSADAMPVGPHRTKSFAVNVGDLERFDAGTEITPELLAEQGLIRHTRIDVKILGNGELTTKLAVTAHRFSAGAREKIEQAGGTVTTLRDDEDKPRSKKRRLRNRGPKAEAPAEETGEEPPAEDAPEEPSEEAPEERATEQEAPDEETPEESEA
jgi:large subunit ribosomal protein L15